MPRILVKIKHEVESSTVVVLSEKSDDQPQRTLMDFVTETCHVPKLNYPEKQEIYQRFLNDKFPSPEVSTWRSKTMLQRVYFLT